MQFGGDTLRITQTVCVTMIIFLMIDALWKGHKMGFYRQKFWDEQQSNLSVNIFFVTKQFFFQFVKSPPDYVPLRHAIFYPCFGSDDSFWGQGFPSAVARSSFEWHMLRRPQTVSVWGSGGRIEMTAAKFMALQAAVQPDWYHSMADGETWQGNTSRKRVRKSVDRTLAHLDECLLAHQKSRVRAVTQLWYFFFFFLPALMGR